MSRLRVLIINPYPIDSDCPIGIMMSNLFKSFNSEDIMQLYTNECNIVNSKFKSKRINLTNSFIIQIRKFISTVIKFGVNNLDKSYSDRSIILNGSITNEWEAWGHLIIPVKLDIQTLLDIISFKPDVIYSQVYSYRLMKLLIKISNKLSCPIVTHTLDDWFSINHKKGFISYIPLYLLDRKMRKILNNGRTHLVASPKMKSHFTKKFDSDFSFVMNCIDYDSTLYLNSKMEDVDQNIFNEYNPMRILYTGGLSLERFAKISEIGDIMDSLKKKNVFYELHVYTSSLHKEQFQHQMNQNIIFHDSVNHIEIPKVLLSANVFLHVETFNANVINFTRYSLSTKIPEYLSVKKPLIYYGPLEISVGEFLKENNFAICIESSTELESKLIDLYIEYFAECKSVEKNYTNAKKIFDCRFMQSEFIRVLNG